MAPPTSSPSSERRTGSRTHHPDLFPAFARRSPHQAPPGALPDIKRGYTGPGVGRGTAMRTRMRGRELPYSSAYNQVDTGYMQQCYADEGVDRSGEPSVLVRASVPDPRFAS